jgi:hypothetical protein
MQTSENSVQATFAEFHFRDCLINQDWPQTGAAGLQKRGKEAVFRRTPFYEVG